MHKFIKRITVCLGNSEIHFDGDDVFVTWDDVNKLKIIQNNITIGLFLKWDYWFEDRINSTCD